MSDREVVCRRIREISQVVDVWQVWVVHNLAVAVILHHDHKYVVKVRNARGNRTLGGEPGARRCDIARKPNSAVLVFISLCSHPSFK